MCLASPHCWPFSLTSRTVALENKPRRVKDGIFNAQSSVIITYGAPSRASQFELKATIYLVRLIRGDSNHTKFCKICTIPFWPHLNKIVCKIALNITNGQR